MDWPSQAFDSTKDTQEIQVHPSDPKKMTFIASNLNAAEESALVEFLCERWEIFVWCPADMPGVPKELTVHAINLDPNARPVRQPLHRFTEPKHKAIASELHRLEEAKFIKEIKKLTWVANPVLVPKKNTNVLCMCVDFTALNKHFPKDHFPLLRIDQIIDSMVGCERLSFLDAYSGYNQIRLKVEDQDKIAFITPYGVYCY
jgi:hypothetical protein